ncbi:hypothetical protein NDU88_006222 [Pleurodeles waltl]|uniref:Uncharacterized protein n=1 Tax=Pleurodeles waltl TaxID=8319 RepID=A0AAV7QHG1_PLEWA|nr:hypothetical protein NDU88_006222 [Pleurodeles waltl]
MARQCPNQISISRARPIHQRAVNSLGRIKQPSNGFPIYEIDGLGTPHMGTGGLKGQRPLRTRPDAIGVRARGAARVWHRLPTVCELHGEHIITL